jgi:hypothetical protein
MSISRLACVYIWAWPFTSWYHLVILLQLPIVKSRNSMIIRTQFEWDIELGNLGGFSEWEIRGWERVVAVNGFDLKICFISSSLFWLDFSGFNYNPSSDFTAYNVKSLPLAYWKYDTVVVSTPGYVGLGSGRKSRWYGDVQFILTDFVVGVDVCKYVSLCHS